MERARYAEASSSTFVLADGGTLTLDEVTDEHRNGGVVSFSLLFRGDVELSQGMRSLRHDALGDVDLFLVPVGVTDGRYEYESVFTRLDESVAT